MGWIGKFWIIVLVFLNNIRRNTEFNNSNNEPH